MQKNLLHLATLVSFLALPLCTATAAPHNDEDTDTDENQLYFSPHSAPYGTSFPEWTAQLWQYAASLPQSVNPLTDATGENCAIGQRGPVWFLIGNFGGETHRECTIPGNKALLLPIQDYFAFDTPGFCGQDASLSIGQMRAMADQGVAGYKLSLEVDGHPIRHLDRFRQKSVAFAVNIPTGNIYEPFCSPALPKMTTSAIDDGYYVMLKPLPAGSHVLRFRATSSAFSLDVTYNLNVLPLRYR